jgi:hypothetical protein
VFTLALVGVVGAALASSSFRDLNARLTGYQEVPTLSTTGSGKFEARINHDESAVDWKLSYQDLESDVTQAHIHFAARAINGPVVVFLCSNLGNGPEGTQACPPPPATISGTFTSVDVLGGALTVGLEAGNLAELIDAIRAGATYANVHSVLRAPGEIRGQIHVHDRRGGN